jgi:hypothetical protein
MVSETWLNDHWNMTDWSLKHDWLVTETWQNGHWNMIEWSLNHDQIVTETWHTVLTKTWLNAFWNMTELSLKLDWMAWLKHDWMVTETWLNDQRNMTEWSLKHDWLVTETWLNGHWNMTEWLLNHDWLIDWLFTVLRPTQEFFTYMETSPLLVKGCKFRPMLGAQGLCEGGIFIVPHLLWHGTSVFPVSSKRPPHLVASYDTRGDVKDLF